MSRGFGVIERSLLRELSEALLPDHPSGPSAQWVAVRAVTSPPPRPAGIEAFMAEQRRARGADVEQRFHHSAGRRAARRLAAAGHLELTEGWTSTPYQRGTNDIDDSYTSRRVLLARLPPVRRDPTLQIGERSDLAAHFVGLVELTASIDTIQSGLLAAEASARGWPEWWVDWPLLEVATRASAIRQVYPQVAYHRRQLDQLPCPDFSWTWTYARWLAHRRALGDRRIPCPPWPQPDRRGHGHPR